MWNNDDDNKENPDEYAGCKLLNGTTSNTTMKQLLTDTSGSWNYTDLGGLRIYRRNHQQGTF